MSLMASLVTTSRMQQCFNVLIDIYHEFLLLFYCCVLLEIKLTTTITSKFIIRTLQNWNYVFDEHTISNTLTLYILMGAFFLSKGVKVAHWFWAIYSLVTQGRKEFLIWNDLTLLFGTRDNTVSTDWELLSHCCKSIVCYSPLHRLHYTEMGRLSCWPIWCL